MKKTSYIFVIVLCLFLGGKVVNANDGGSNTDFWAIDNKTHCVSVVNPEAAGDSAFLVFDYSAKIGQVLGRPWVIIEKGKCYQTEDGSEVIYLIKIKNGDEKEIFSNYSAYESVDSIKDKFCKKMELASWYSCHEPDLKYEIEEIVNFEGMGATTTTEEEIHFMGIEINKLFPTKYDLGMPITFFSVETADGLITNDLKQIINHPSFISAGNLYTSLAKELNGILQTCDSRIREEETYVLETYHGGSGLTLYPQDIIWRLSDGQDISSIAKLEITDNISLLGCKVAFSNFIKKHQTDFDTLDRLTEEVVKKYPNVLSNEFKPIVERDSFEIEKIMAYVNSSEAEKIDVTKLPHPDNSTSLDEPTIEKKTEMVVNSSNPFLQIYFWLPLVALIGLLSFLAFKKRQ